MLTVFKGGLSEKDCLAKINRGQKWYQLIGIYIVHLRYLLISNFIGPSPWKKRNTVEH